jgi:hypothetical protein
MALPLFLSAFSAAPFGYLDSNLWTTLIPSLPVPHTRPAGPHGGNNKVRKAVSSKNKRPGCSTSEFVTGHYGPSNIFKIIWETEWQPLRSGFFDELGAIDFSLESVRFLCLSLSALRNIAVRHMTLDNGDFGDLEFSSHGFQNNIKNLCVCIIRMLIH